MAVTRPTGDNQICLLTSPRSIMLDKLNFQCARLKYTHLKEILLFTFLVVSSLDSRGNYPSFYGNINRSYTFRNKLLIY